MISPIASIRGTERNGTRVNNVPAFEQAELLTSEAATLTVVRNKNFLNSSAAADGRRSTTAAIFYVQVPRTGSSNCTWREFAQAQGKPERVARSEPTSTPTIAANIRRLCTRTSKA